MVCVGSQRFEPARNSRNNLDLRTVSDELLRPEGCFSIQQELEKSPVGFCWEAEVGTVLGTAHELDATGKDAKCQTLDLLQIWNSMFTEVVNRNNVCDMSADRVRIFSNPNCADFYFDFVARDICVLANSCSETADVRKLSLLNLSVLNDTHFVLGRSILFHHQIFARSWLASKMRSDVFVCGWWL